MPVFDDPRKELAALQSRMEDQEEWFRQELDSAKRMIGENPGEEKPAAAYVPVRDPGNTYAVKKARQASGAEHTAPKKKGIRGLVVLALLEIAGILGIGAYWLLVLLR